MAASATGAAAPINSVTLVADGHECVEPQEDRCWDGKRAASGIFGIDLRVEGMACDRRAVAGSDVLASFADFFSAENGSDLFLEPFGVASSSSSIAYLEKEHVKRFKPKQFLQT